jgi:hypothetical protein
MLRAATQVEAAAGGRSASLALTTSSLDRTCRLCTGLPFG